MCAVGSWQVFARVEVLFPHLAGLAVEQVEVRDGVLHVRARTRETTGCLGNLLSSGFGGGY